MYGPLVALVTLLGSASILAQNEPLIRPIQEEEQAALFPSRDMLELGRTVAVATCASCHGMDGISDSEGKPQLAGQRVLYLYRTLLAFQSGLRPDDASMHEHFLNNKAMLAVAVYYADLTPVQTAGIAGLPTIAEVTAEDPFMGIREAVQKCTKCHDATGNSSDPGKPSLTAQDPEYFVASMLSYLDGSRSHKTMKKRVGRLDEKTILEMGIFYGVQKPSRTETQGEGDANVGRRLAEDCKNCHGDDGNAEKAANPTLAGQDAEYFVRVMNLYKDGKRQHKKMFEAAESLSEQNIIDLATFYAAQVPRRRDVYMPLTSSEWITRCERCHGIDGNSSDPRYPMLAGQDASYLRKVLQAFASRTRESTIMHAMADPLSPLDIDRISTYFEVQQPKAVVYVQLPVTDGEQE